MSESNSGAPQFKIDVDVQPGLTLVRCSGRLVIENASVLRAEVQKYIRRGSCVVLDLTDVTHCDSMGVGAVISLYVSSKSAGCNLELINLGPQIRKLFSMTQVLSLFESAADSSCRMP